MIESICIICNEFTPNEWYVGLFDKPFSGVCVDRVHGREPPGKWLTKDGNLVKFTVDIIDGMTFGSYTEAANALALYLQSQ